MNLKYEILAAQTMAARGREAEENGNDELAIQCYKIAVEKYRALAQAFPEKEREFLVLAEDIESRIGVGSFESQGIPSTNNKPVKSKANAVKKEYKGYNLNIACLSKRISLEEIVGLDEAKNAIKQDLIFPLNYPERYKKHNLEVGNNVLLYGPPGTGKTTFAKAVASDVDVPFININSNSLIDPYIGVTGKNIDNLFNEVRRFVSEQKTPVILFIDEIDAIAQKRGGENKTSQEAVPTLIKQLEGFDSDNTGIIVIAASNLSEIIDRAVLDRFKSQIYISLPTEVDRAKLFELKLKGFNVEPEIMSRINLAKLARESENLSGRKITQICDNFVRTMIELGIQGKSSEKSYTDIILDLINKAR